MANNEALPASLSKYIVLPCGRDNPPHHEVLNIFQYLTPPECEFYPTRLWDRKTEDSTCGWHVLYTQKNPTTQSYSFGNKASNLKDLLLRFPLANATIMEYYFYQDHRSLEAFNQGWVMVWKLSCHHVQNSYDIDKLLKSKRLPMMKIWNHVE
ncbi:unnamed protein product [Tenebrio molitor]|jgi:hypothetical protein|nr:unnamed protein product [Tenebrio molitor]